VKVRLYWMAAATMAILKIAINLPLGKGANQTKTNAVSEKRKAINKIGGKWFIAPFANTKPNPHKSGTVSAINVCLGVSWFIAVIQIAAVLGDFNDQHRDFP